MRAGIADVYGAHVKTKTFAVKPVKATAAGIVASAADGDLTPGKARSQSGGGAPSVAARTATCPVA